MGVNLRGRETGMTKQLFHRVNVRPIIEQVGGKTMP